MGDAFIAAYLRAQRKELAALDKAVGTKLDLSYESLDVVEDYYRGVVDTMKEFPPVRPLSERVARYVGATLAGHVGGTWVRAPGYGKPVAAIAVPGLARPFNPLGPVLSARRLKWPGLIRDAAEKWDLPLRRATLARLLANAKRERAQLVKDVAELTGKRVKSLGRGKQSVDLVEEAVRVLAGSDATHGRRRAMRERVVLHLGDLAAQAVGHGTWTLVEDPDYAVFGEFEILGWSPAQLVRALQAEPGDKARYLYESLRTAIADAPDSEPKSKPAPPARTIHKPGVWFVMCTRKRALSAARLEPVLATLAYADVKLVGETFEIVVHDRLTKRDADVFVHLSTARHVPIEAREIAERKKRPAVAKLDARYEVVFDLRFSDEVFNTLCVVAEKLAKATAGTIYDVTGGRFV